MGVEFGDQHSSTGDCDLGNGGMGVWRNRVMGEYGGNGYGGIDE